MAIVTGTSGTDFVHVLGDGRTGPLGSTDLPLATSGNDDISVFGGNDSVFGGAGNDRIFGGADNDTLNGLGGDDTLDGGTGSDVLAGGTGNDTYFVDSAGDLIVEGASGGTLDMVFASVSFALAGDDRIELLAARDAAGVTAINLTGNSFAQNISGNAGANVLTGNGGNDTLLGLGGADTLKGGTGDDSLLGGTGDDWYYVDSTGDVIAEGAGGGTADAVLASVSFTLAADDNIERLTTTAQAGLAAIDLTGNDLAQRIIGNAGANALTGNGGNDTLDGKGGTDTLLGGTGTDRIFGGLGNDLIVIGASSDVVGAEVYDGGGDSDTLQGLGTGSVNLSAATITGIENLTGFSGGLVLRAGQLDAITGRVMTGALTLSDMGTVDLSDADVLTAVINLSAGGNNLTLRTGYGPTGGYFYGTVNGGAGNDTVTVLDGGNVAYMVGEVLNGNGGNDSLTGSWDGDTIFGGAGYDTLAGGAGLDYLYGGFSDDRFVIANASHIEVGEVYDGALGFDELDGTGVATAVNLAGVTISDMSLIRGFSGGLVLTAGQLDQFDRLVDTGTITLAGAGAANLWDAKVVTNVINLSAAGNALTLRGGSGYYAGGYFDGTVNGGAGNDSVTVLDGGYAGGYIGAILNGGGGHDSLTGSWDDDNLNGGAGNDTLIGGAGADGLIGSGGNDSLAGGTGDDDVTGGAGRDSLYGGDQDDRLAITLASDIVAGEIYDGGAGSDTLDGFGVAAAVDLTGVSIAAVENIVGFAGGLSLTAGQLDAFNGAIDTGQITIGTAGVIDLSDADVLTGAILLSGAGNTLTLRGGTGPTGGFFDGTVTGGVAADTVTVLDGGSFGNAGATLNGGGGNDSLTGSWHNDRLEGGADIDTLIGGGGDDTLLGGDGGDNLFGGDGHDSLVAGGGVDFYDYLFGGDGFDFLIGDGGDVLFGGAREDNLFAGGAGCFLDGGAGNDYLVGWGVPPLPGEEDWFVFSADAVGGHDTIVGFNFYPGGVVGTDIIDIDDGLTDPFYIRGNPFGGGRTEVRFNGSVLEVDLDGNARADFLITVLDLISTAQLSQSNFL